MALEVAMFQRLNLGSEKHTHLVLIAIFNFPIANEVLKSSDRYDLNSSCFIFIFLEIGESRRAITSFVSFVECMEWLGLVR